jgi:hypothetical protein
MIAWGPVPIGTLAASLVAFEKVVRQSRPLFEKLYSAEIADIRVFVNEIEAGSLFDDFLIKFVFKDDEGYTAFVQALRRKTGVDAMTERYPTIGPILTTVLLLGGLAAVSRGCGSGGDGININLRNSYGNVITIAAADHQMPVEEMQGLINTSITNRYLLATNAAKIFLPAKREGADASIKMDDRMDLVISPGSVKEVPAIVPKAQAQETQEVHTDVAIQIRALDLDNRKKGWGVVIPSVSNARIPMELDPQVNTADLLGRNLVQADIEVFYRIDAEGEEHAKSAFLRKVYPPPAD